MATWAETELDTDTGGKVGGGGVDEFSFGPAEWYGGGEGDDAVVPEDDFRRILIPFDDPIRMQDDSSCLYK